MEAENLEQIKDYIFDQLPGVLEKDPRFVILVEGIVAEKFPRRDEFARLLDELRELRIDSEKRWRELRSDMNRRFEQMDKRLDQVDKRFEEVDQRFERLESKMDSGFKEVDQRFERLESKMDSGFHDMYVHIDRLGSRWGIRNEKIFRQTMKEILEGSMGMKVKEYFIGGEQFDCIISDGQHILVEITASGKPGILERLRRKRQLYTEETGITPHRFILAVGSIHSRRAEELRADGFEVIEPEE